MKAARAARRRRRPHECGEGRTKEAIAAFPPEKVVVHWSIGRPLVGFTRRGSVESRVLPPLAS
jgi:hypothetical protein